MPYSKLIQCMFSTFATLIVIIIVANDFLLGCTIYIIMVILMVPFRHSVDYK